MFLNLLSVTLDVILHEPVVNSWALLVKLSSSLCVDMHECVVWLADGLVLTIFLWQTNLGDCFRLCWGEPGFNCADTSRRASYPYGPNPYTSEISHTNSILEINFLNFRKSQILKLHIQALMKWRLWHLLHRIRLAISYWKVLPNYFIGLSLFVNITILHIRTKLCKRVLVVYVSYFFSFLCIESIDISLLYGTCIHASC